MLFRKDGLTVTTAGLDTDPTSGDNVPIIWLDIGNDGEEDAWLGVSGGVVNGYMDDVVLVEFYEDEDGYFGSSYDTLLRIPAGSQGRYALCWSRLDVPGVNLDTLGEVEFCFTLAEDEWSWPDYISAPVTVAASAVETVELSSLGTVAVDDEDLLLVVGDQDYEDWFGPMIYMYVENRSDRCIALEAVSAEADGLTGDLVFYYASVAPGRREAGWVCFDGDIRALKGIEDLTLGLRLYEADTLDELGYSGTGEYRDLEPVTVQYPPQVWGEYECEGLKLVVKPRYNDLITVETGGEDGSLFSVFETASLEAECSFEGAGALFGISRVSEDRFHELLFYDMSGTRPFARDENGNYYLYNFPTDVRVARDPKGTKEEQEKSIEQWFMLCQWADTAADSFRERNGLEYANVSCTMVDSYVARAAWMEEETYTLSTEEYGPVELDGVDGAPYANFVLQGCFYGVDAKKTPYGEYVSLTSPEGDVRLDFFFDPGNYVRVNAWGSVWLMQAMWYDENISIAEAMQGWYYAAAEQAGLREPDGSLDPFLGDWHESIAGRATLEIFPSVAPGKLSIYARWPNSAFAVAEWEITASPDEEGRLVYENAHLTVTEYQEDGSPSVFDERWEESGWFALDGEDGLIWHSDGPENDEDCVFLR